MRTCRRSFQATFDSDSKEFAARAPISDDARMSVAIQKSAALPLAFAVLGTSYFALTMLRKPHVADRQAVELWERHKRDATIGLIAGLGASAVLWWSR